MFRGVYLSSSVKDIVKNYWSVPGTVKHTQVHIIICTPVTKLKSLHFRKYIKVLHSMSMTVTSLKDNSGNFAQEGRDCEER